MLEDAIAAGDERGHRLQGALSHRILGEIMCQTKELPKAYKHLQSAQLLSTETGLLLEQAACQQAWGLFHLLSGDRTSARAAWEKALSIAGQGVPELSWQIHSRLAQLEVEENNPALALEHFRKAVEGLTRLRRNIWQPTLIVSYLGDPGCTLARAIALACEMNVTEALFSFIEASKAQTILAQWTMPDYPAYSAVNSETIRHLVAEIRWLQQKIRESGRSGRHTVHLALSMELHERLLERARTYERLIAQLERANSPEHPISNSHTGQSSQFTVNDFYRFSNEIRGDQWVALSYYLTDAHLYGVVITPRGYHHWSNEKTALVNYALQVCTQARPDRGWPSAQLAALGNWLLPDFVREQWTTETVLLISPSRHLNRLPWAALLVGQERQPLASVAIPIILPSLQSLGRLARRPSTFKRGELCGLVVAVSEFQARHPQLPAVLAEADSFTGETAESIPKVDFLREHEATFPALVELTAGNGLAHYDFLHIATHVFSDCLTGRLSGLALSDRDVLLDELWRLAPLPPLVTLSGCSGLASHLYDGDEPVGLVTTCLAAGAQHVIGSLWPVADDYLPGFIKEFYQHLSSGMSPGAALALTQRKFYASGEAIEQWGSFQCIGLP
jgi:CHAT domain-containing protein